MLVKTIFVTGISSPGRARPPSPKLPTRRMSADEADLNGPRGLLPSPTSASSGRAQSRPQRLAPFAGKRSAGRPGCDLRCGLLGSLRYVRNLQCMSAVYVLFAPAAQPYQRLMRSSRRLINQRRLCLPLLKGIVPLFCLKRDPACFAERLDAGAPTEASPSASLHAAKWDLRLVVNSRTVNMTDA
jgi:hypothetical protein